MGDATLVRSLLAGVSKPELSFRRMAIALAGFDYIDVASPALSACLYVGENSRYR
jgi:hypothetical protein